MLVLDLPGAPLAVAVQCRLLGKSPQVVLAVVRFHQVRPEVVVLVAPLLVEAQAVAALLQAQEAVQCLLELQQVQVVGCHQQQKERSWHRLGAQVAVWLHLGRGVVRFRLEPQQVPVVALHQAWEVVQCHQSQQQEQHWHQLEAQVVVLLAP